MFAIYASTEKLTRKSNISIFHDLQSNWKVSEMGWEVKKNIRSWSEQCLLVSNLETEKNLPQDCQDQIGQTIFGTLPPLQLLVRDLNHFYRYSNKSYGDPFGRRVGVRELGGASR